MPEVPEALWPLEPPGYRSALPSEALVPGPSIPLAATGCRCSSSASSERGMTMAVEWQMRREREDGDRPAGPVSAARAGAYYRAAILTEGKHEHPRALV